MIDFILEALGEVCDVLLSSRKTPKFIKYMLVILLIGFLMYLFINTAMTSPYLWGRIFGAVFALFFLLFGFLLIHRIRKNK